MPKKYKSVLKSIGRRWFIIIIAIIIIVALFGFMDTIYFIVALWMAGITLVAILLSYVPKLFSSNKFNNLLKSQKRIDDKTVARTLNKKLEKIRERMFKLSQDQQKKPYLIVYLNKQYIFYSEEVIKEFKALYNKGLGEKEILDKLKSKGLELRAEIKAIEETLIKNDRLDKRETTVKEFREKQRFS